MYILQKSDNRNICIINGYAPQSKRQPSDKYRFYEELENTFRTFKSNYITIILGDFNARLHSRLDTETYLMGPNIFGRGEEFAQRLGPDTLEHREFFTQFCKGNGLCVSNTFCS